MLFKIHLSIIKRFMNFFEKLKRLYCKDFDCSIRTEEKELKIKGQKREKVLVIASLHGTLVSTLIPRTCATKVMMQCNSQTLKIILFI